MIDIPEGKSGGWKVEKFIVTEEAAKMHNLQQMFHPGRGNRTIKPGTYTKLTHEGSIVMSDTPAELRDHSYFVFEACGRVLVNGLGLGAVIQALFNKPEVKHITVIEISKDVINLVAKHLKSQFGDRLEIIHADAFIWKPPKGVRYNVVWHDIWSDICGDNLEGMKRLHRKYGKRCDWQASWCRAEHEFQQR